MGVNDLVFIAAGLILLACVILFTKPGRKVGRLIKWTILEAVFFSMWLLPRDKKLIAFGSEFGFCGNPKYLLEALGKYPVYRGVWIAKDRDVYDRVKKAGYEVCMCDSREGRRVQLRAATLIHSHTIKDDFNYLLVGGATAVNVWHGVGLKRSWYRNRMSFAGKWMAAPASPARSLCLLWDRTDLARENYFIGTSETVDAYYPATYHVPADHVLMLGQARNDVFYRTSPEEAWLPECLRRGKVVAYLPTHRDYGEKRGNRESVGADIDYAGLSELLGRYGYTLVVKQHSFNAHAQAAGGGFPNIVDLSRLDHELDTQLILKHTDILITDYSSVYTDFLLLDRPMIFYCYDLEQYLQKWELNFDYDAVTPGPKAFDCRQLTEELEKLLQGRDGYEAERRRVKRIFYAPANQGPVAEKQIDYIIGRIIGP